MIASIPNFGCCSDWSSVYEQYDKHDLYLSGTLSMCALYFPQSRVVISLLVAVSSGRSRRSATAWLSSQIACYDDDKPFVIRTHNTLRPLLLESNCCTRRHYEPLVFVIPSKGLPRRPAPSQPSHFGFLHCHPIPWRAGL